MTCTAKLPVDEIINAVKASIRLDELGGVSYAELEDLVVNYTQKQIDAIRQKILDQAPEKYVVSQGLEGYTFSTTLNDGTVLTTDMRLLVGSIAEEVGGIISGYATKEELQQIQTDLSHDISSIDQNVSANTADIAQKADQSDLDITNQQLANKVNKTDVIDVAHGGTGATTLTAAQTNLGIDKVASANARLTAKKQEFPNVFVDSNGQLQKTQLATWLDHAKMYNGLVPNGSFQRGDATGWPTTGTMDTVDFPMGASGAFSVGKTFDTIFTKIPVNPYQKYRHSMVCKMIKTGTTGVDIGIRQYDVDLNEIQYNHANHRANTVTTLAQDLKIGDTKVYLTSLSSWQYNPAFIQDRGFKFYNYTDSRGYLYDPLIMPYSRYVANDSSGWWDNSASSFDMTNNIITLNKPWSYANPKDPNGTWLAGNKIAQIINGPAYYVSVAYNYGINKTGVLDWTYLESNFNGFNLTATSDDMTKFRAGTAYVSPFLVTNRLVNPDVFKMSHHYFEKI